MLKIPYIEKLDENKLEKFLSLLARYNSLDANYILDALGEKTLLDDIKNEQYDLILEKLEKLENIEEKYYELSEEIKDMEDEISNYLDKISFYERNLNAINLREKILKYSDVLARR